MKLTYNPIRISVIGIAITALITTALILIPGKAEAAEAHISACGILGVSGTTYILDNDVTSTGTCFTIAASNIILNLNGHTITYNTSAADSKYAFANVDDNGAVIWNKSNIRITNGTINQSSNCQMGKCLKSHAVYFKEESYVEADHLTISYQGDDNEGITLQGSSSNVDAQIHDNILRPNGTKRTLTHFGGFSAINVGGTSGNIDIYNNDIQGKGYSGINYGFTNLKPLTDTVHINNNTIKMASPVRDGYAISIASPVGDNIGFEIANNTINQSNGRGILINGNYNDSSVGPGLGTIHDNYVEVRESRDAGEYDAPGASTGICLRFGAHDIKVYNNTIKAYAGQNACPSSFSTSRGSDCVARALKIHAGKIGKNLEIYNNTVEALTTDAALTASALYAINSYLNSPTPDINVVFHNNTATSNSLLVDLSGSDGSGNYEKFTSNTLIKAANPLAFHSIRAGYWTQSANENVFIDNNWQGGASKDDVLLATSGGGTYSLYTKWYLTITAKDSAGNLVPGASVIASPNDVSTEPVIAITNTGGIAQLELTEYKRFGQTYPSTTSYSQYSPYTIAVSKDGFGQAQAQVTMDSSKTLEMTLSPSASLVKQVDKALAKPGDILTYTLTYSNPTQNTYTNARIEDQIPLGTTFVSASNGGISNGTKVIWTIGNLSPGMNVSVTMQVRVQ